MDEWVNVCMSITRLGSLLVAQMLSRCSSRDEQKHKFPSLVDTQIVKKGHHRF